MNQLNKKQLNSKFWKGETSLLEESILKNDRFEDESPDALYFSFLNKQQFAPEGFEEDIWKSIKNHKKSKSLKLKRWIVAANIALFVGLTGFWGYQNRQSKLEQQFALIEQTLNHVSAELTTSHNNEVLYQDSYIVIVAEN